MTFTTLYEGQFRPPIALRIDLVLQRNCGKYWSFTGGRRINFTYDYIALFFGVIFFPVLEQELCKEVMRKACRVSDAWREKTYEGLNEFSLTTDKGKEIYQLAKEHNKFPLGYL